MVERAAVCGWFLLVITTACGGGNATPDAKVTPDASRPDAQPDADTSRFAPAMNYTAAGPSSVAIGDLNGDGKLDLVTANGAANSAGVYLNSGAGVFSPPTGYPIGTGPTSIAVGDLDGDTDLDIVASLYFANAVGVLLGNGDGTFGAPTTYATIAKPQQLALGNLNGDARPDVAVVGAAMTLSDQGSILINQGDGTFAAQVIIGAGAGPCAVAAGRIDEDTDEDVVVGNCTDNTLSVLLSNGDGTLASQVTYAATFPVDVAIGDLSGDAKPDLVAANFGGTGSLSVLLNSGSGTFGAATSSDAIAAYAIAIGDIDSDGTSDVAVAGMADPASGPFGVHVLINDGTAHFESSFAPVIGQGINGLNDVALGDLNGDGRLDLATVCTPAGIVSVLLQKP